MDEKWSAINPVLRRKLMETMSAKRIKFEQWCREHDLEIPPIDSPDFARLFRDWLADSAEGLPPATDR